MLEYEWGNPSSMLLSGEEPTQDSDQTRQILDQYNQNLAGNLFPPQQPNSTNYISANHHHSFHEQQQSSISPNLQLYDPRIYTTSTNNNVLSYPPPAHHPPTSFSLESMPDVASCNFMMLPKTEDICGQRVAAASASIDYSSSRIGLNLGGRTYFSSSEDDFVNRFYRRSRQLEPVPANIPRCQAEGCNADLTHAKHYHRRHKVCEFHSKAATVLTAGITQRFCQQCSRFHLLTEFDQGKRSCRKRLADHNRRRRKSNPPPPPPPPPSQPPPQHQQQQSQLRNTSTTTADQNPARSSPDSGGMHSSSSSVTVAMSHMECHSIMGRT